MIQNFLRRMSISRTSEKKSAPPLIALTLAGAPNWADRDYASMAKNGIMRNAVVYRCIAMIADAAASVPWILYEGNREIETHPILSLLRRPNPYDDGTSFLTRWYAFLLGSGNAYMQAACIDKDIRELYILRPDRVGIVTDNNGWPVAYDYSGGGRIVRHTANSTTGFCPVLHAKMFHPLDDSYGLSPLEAAATSIDILNASAGWTKSLLDNAARPSGALIYKGTDGSSTLTDDQFRRLKNELEATYQGFGNAGRPMVLEGGLEWRSMSFSPSDMNASEIRDAAAREIALALGVPSMLLGIPGDNTYANYREANLSFWRQTVLPLVCRTADAMSSWLAPIYGNELRLCGDSDKITALADERKTDWQRIDSASFLTANEKRIAAGYTPFAGGDAIDEHAR